MALYKCVYYYYYYYYHYATPPTWTICEIICTSDNHASTLSLNYYCPDHDARPDAHGNHERLSTEGNGMSIYWPNNAVRGDKAAMRPFANYFGHIIITQSLTTAFSTIFQPRKHAPSTLPLALPYHSFPFFTVC